MVANAPPSSSELDRQRLTPADSTGNIQLRRTRRLQSSPSNWAVTAPEPNRGRPTPTVCGRCVRHQFWRRAGRRAAEHDLSSLYTGRPAVTAERQPAIDSRGPQIRQLQRLKGTGGLVPRSSWSVRDQVDFPVTLCQPCLLFVDCDDMEGGGRRSRCFLDKKLFNIPVIFKGIKKQEMSNTKLICGPAQLQTSNK